MVFTRGTLLVAVLLAALVTWPGWWVATPFWAGLSSNLFAAVVATAFTIFGVNVLLEGIQRRSAAGRRQATLAETERTLVWILNRIHQQARSLTRPFVTEADWERVPQVLAAALLSRKDELFTAANSAPWSEIRGALAMIEERSTHLRMLATLASESIPTTAAAKLIRALGLVEAMVGYGTTTEEPSATDRPLTAFAIRSLLVEAITELALCLGSLRAERR